METRIIHLLNHAWQSFTNLKSAITKRRLLRLRVFYARWRPGPSTLYGWTLNFWGLASWNWLQAGCLINEMQLNPRLSQHLFPRTCWKCFHYKISGRLGFSHPLNGPLTIFKTRCQYLVQVIKTSNQALNNLSGRSNHTCSHSLITDTIW